MGHLKTKTRNPGTVPSVVTDLFGTYSNATNTFPAAGWLPFSVNAWPNLLLGASPTVDGNSTSYVSVMTAAATTSMCQDKQVGPGFNDYEHPVYWGKASDPVYSFNPSASAYADTYSLRTSNGGPSFHAPTGMKAALGSDNHVIIVDQTTGTAYDFWQCNATFAGWASPTSGIDDVGHQIGAHAIGIYPFWNTGTHTGTGDARLINAPGGDHGDGSNAALTSLYAGQVRGVELANNLIPHPISFVFQKTHLSVYPAQGTGSDAAGWPPEGQFFQVTLTSAAIEAQSVPRWHKTILHACADYGFYVDDTGANNGYAMDIHFESPQSYLAYSLTDPFATFAAANLDSTIVSNGGGNYTFKFSGLDTYLRNSIQAISPTYIQSGR